jgi:hypothetical protein
MMDVDFLPEHLVIVGGSYIGLEFAQMYRRFGSEVTVVERAPKLLPREDDDVAAEIRAILEREGVEIRTAPTASLRAARRRIAVSLRCGEGEPRRSAATCCSPWAHPEHGDLGSTAPASSRSPRLHQGRRPMPHERAGRSGHWATPMAAARSRTPPTTITRSWRRTSSTATPARSRSASRRTPSSSIRRWAARA